MTCAKLHYIYHWLQKLIDTVMVVVLDPKFARNHPKLHDFSRISDANSRELRGICANSGIFFRFSQIAPICDYFFRNILS
jgi:hypothetical protein